MADVDYTLNLHFNFNASGRRSAGQTLTATPEAAVLFNSLNYVITDIAFYAAKKQQNEIRRNLESKFEGIVRRELTNMGRKIATMAIGITNQYQTPKGRLEIEGPVSDTLRSLNQTGPMNIGEYTGPWAHRSRAYLARKRKKFGHTKWWQNTGQLKAQLRKPSLYTGSFGPVRVKFEAEQIPIGSSGVKRVSNFTTTRGRPSGRISVGDIHMSVLGRITTEMLADPDGHAYDSRYTGLFDMLPDDVALKLGGAPPHRSVIEPFLSYYITRQIPNSIFRTLEDSTRGRQSGLAGSRAFTG